MNTPWWLVEKEQKQQNLLADIKEIDFDKHLGDRNINNFLKKQEEHNKSELEWTGKSVLGWFIPNIISTFVVEWVTSSGEKIDFHTKIRAKTMTNLLEKDIIENIRKNGSIDLLDIYFEFDVGFSSYSEYHCGEEQFFQHTQKKIIEFIKRNPKMEERIVNDYCNVLLTSLNDIKIAIKIFIETENIQSQIHDILSNDLEKSDSILSNDELFNLINKRNELSNKLASMYPTNLIKLYIDTVEAGGEIIYQNILKSIEEGKKIIDIDSKYFYLDNWDILYDEVVEKSKYHDYYKAELDLIKEKKEIIGKYINSYYVSLWCWNGKKDKVMLDAAQEYYDKTWKWISDDWYQPFISDQNVLLIDSSLKSLSKAERLLEKELPVIHREFSLNWIDEFSKSWKILTNLSTNQSQMVLFQSSINKELFQKKNKTITLLWWTFGNFWSYQPIFLQQVNDLMIPWDILIISSFNLPKNAKEQEVIDKYNTPETHNFITNFFQKLGIPKENIDVTVTYKNSTIHIDAKIIGDWNEDLVARVSGKETKIPVWTTFACIQSQRLDESEFKKILERSEIDLSIKEIITKDGSPFSLYVLQKE